MWDGEVNGGIWNGSVCGSNCACERSVGISNDTRVGWR